MKNLSYYVKADAIPGEVLLVPPITLRFLSTARVILRQALHLPQITKAADLTIILCIYLKESSV